MPRAVRVPVYLGSPLQIMHNRARRARFFFSSFLFTSHFLSPLPKNQQRELLQWHKENSRNAPGARKPPRHDLRGQVRGQPGVCSAAAPQPPPRGGHGEARGLPPHHGTGPGCGGRRNIRVSPRARTPHGGRRLKQPLPTPPCPTPPPRDPHSLRRAGTSSGLRAAVAAPLGGLQPPSSSRQHARSRSRMPSIASAGTARHGPARRPPAPLRAGSPAPGRAEERPHPAEGGGSAAAARGASPAAGPPLGPAAQAAAGAEAAKRSHTRLVCSPWALSGVCSPGRFS